MTRKTPSDFGSHDDWLTHVRSEIPLPEQPYALAVGRMDLFRSFYRIQGLPFPTQFAEEARRIVTMQDPERTAALEALNDLIFKSLTVYLFNRAQPATPFDEWSRHHHLHVDRFRNCSRILCRRTPISRFGVVTKVVYPTARLPRSGTIIWLRNSGRIAPRRSTSPAQWSSWTDFSFCFMTIICHFPGSLSSASGSSTVSGVPKEWPKHALS